MADKTPGAEAGAGPPHRHIINSSQKISISCNLLRPDSLTLFLDLIHSPFILLEDSAWSASR